MLAMRSCVRRFTTSLPRYSGSGPSVAMKEVDPNWDPRGSGSGRNDGWERHDPSDHANVPLWNKLVWFVTIPAVVVTSIYAYVVEKEHMSHPEHRRPPFVAYEYLRRRTKPFPWGDGNHTLFHNPEVNALPDGYETELPSHGHDEAHH